VFFPTNDGRLAELLSLWPQANWGYHAAPQDADVQAIADAGLMRPGFVLTISSSGDLYELELGPAHVWRKHSRAGSELEDVPLLPGNGVVMKGAHGVDLPADSGWEVRTRSRRARDGFLLNIVRVFWSAHVSCFVFTMVRIFFATSLSSNFRGPPSHMERRCSLQ
jgi:hypothetical protein